MTTKKAAKKFARKKAVTLPTIKLEDNTTYYLRFDSEIKTEMTVEQSGKDKGQEKEIDVVNATNLELDTQGRIVVGFVLKKELELAYPDSDYVGKSFEITKKKVDGKRYKAYEVFEIEA